jgi:hypothetical protein
VVTENKYGSAYSDYVNTNNYTAASIKTPVSGNLTELNLGTFNASNVGGRLTINIYTSTWNGYQPVINAYYAQYYYDPTGSDWVTHVNTGGNQLDLTNSSGPYLDNSQTTNNIWFVMLKPSNAHFYWLYANSSSDVTHINSTYSYTSVDHGSNWNPVLDSNGNSQVQVLKFSESPENFSATPAEINMQVNGTQVQSGLGSGYQGMWVNTTIFNGGASGHLSFNFTCEWPNATWFVNTSEVDYFNPMLMNQSDFFISIANSPIRWMVEYDPGSELDSGNFTNFFINFTIPQIWIPINAYRDNNSNPFGFIYWDNNMGNRIVNLQIPNLYCNGNWILFSNSSNLGATILITQSGVTVSQIFNNESITINTSFISNFTGQITLEIYSPIGNLIYSSLNYSVNNQESFSFGVWNSAIYDTNLSGVYTFEVNGTNNIDNSLYLIKNINILNETTTNSNTSSTTTSTNTVSTTNTSSSTNNTSTSESTSNNNLNNQNQLIYIILFIIVGCVILGTIIVIRSIKKKNKN